MDRKYELIAYKKIPHLNLFLNRIRYRSVHFHNAFELLCLFDGSCTVTMPGRTIAAKKGDVLLINHNAAHEIRSEETADFIVIQFSRHTFTDYFPRIRTTFFDRIRITEELCKADAAELWRLIRDLAAAYLSDAATAPLRCVTDLSALIAFLYEKCPHTVYSQGEYDMRKKTEQRMQRIVERINGNFDSKLLLQEIADSEKLTVTHLSHLFREQLGVTFRDYLNNLRFENAARMLSDMNVTVSEVALNCGFSDVKYMTKMFRQRCGQTPAAYRKRRLSHDGGTAYPDEYFYSKEESLRLIRALGK